MFFSTFKGFINKEIRNKKLFHPDNQLIKPFQKQKVPSIC